MIYVQTTKVSPIQKALAVLLSAVMLVLVVMFSMVMIPVIVVAGLIGFGYLYWKTRALRKAMAQTIQDQAVIEGEAVVIHEHQETKHLN